MAKVVACPICGTPFVWIEGEGREYCSEKCKRKAEDREYWQKHEKACERGKLFLEVKYDQLMEERNHQDADAERREVDAIYERDYVLPGWNVVVWHGRRNKYEMRGNTSMIRCALAELPLNRARQAAINASR